VQKMKLWKLEAIRGLAAIYVAIGHTFNDGLLILRFGQEAVIVFFLLSGFVIEYSHHHSRDKSFKGYFTKRVTRIYSVFLAMLVLCTVLIKPDLMSLDFWRILGGNLLMLQDFDSGKPNVIVPTLFASALWSLHYEWWFYMLFYPISTYVEKKKQAFLVSCAAIISALVYLRFPEALPRLTMYFLIWWLGVELARSYIANGTVKIKDLRVPGLSLIVVTIILAVNILLYRYSGGSLRFGIHPVLEVRHFSAAIFTLLIALAWQRLNWIGFPLLKVGVLIAPISYSLYISHQPLLVHARYLDFIDNQIIECSLYLITLLVFCWATELKLYPAIRRKIKKAQQGSGGNG
jgi:peptidoglycan/LPS O-acetylase OafA/YrhL